jgi:DNA-binding transcriptional regulator YiaG
VDLNDLQELSALRALLRSGAAGSIRTAAGLSLAEVAAVLQTSKTTVLRWERGERTPRGDLALAYWELLQRLMKERVGAR